MSAETVVQSTSYPPGLMQNHITQLLHNMQIIHVAPLLYNIFVYMYECSAENTLFIEYQPPLNLLYIRWLITEKV